MQNRWLWLGMALVTIGGLSGCKHGAEHSYPDGPEERRRAERGKLTGDGLTLFGGDDRAAAGNIGGPTIGVNRYLWQATLDTFSFMPLASADPFGGVIISDWYEDPQAKGERFKANVIITDTALHANAVKVRIFKQRKNGAMQWEDIAVDPSVPRDMENAILERARELRIRQEQ